MIFVLPILVVIAIILAIDHIYFSDTQPKDNSAQKEMRQKQNDNDATQKYLDRYIKK